MSQQPLTCVQFWCQFLLILALSFIEIWILEYAWNESMPHTFGLPTINFPQAFFLYMVSSMLIYPKYNKSFPITSNNNNGDDHIV